MTQTLQEVLEHGSEFLAELDSIGSDCKGLTLYNGSRIDAVVVLPDEVAKRYYEVIYVYNTHFTPSGLPGVGMATGDFIVREDKMYLILHGGVCFGNMEALQLFRQHEPKFREWYERQAELDRKVKAFCSALFHVPSLKRALTGPGKSGFWFELLQKAERWNATEVNFQDVNLPGKFFPDALVQAVVKLSGRKKKGTAGAARLAAALETELRPYADCGETARGIRKNVRHKGVPIIDGDMVALSAPTYSGRASLHNKNANDDLMGAMPNGTDFFMTAGQTGIGSIVHIGGGEVQGENFVMLVPKTPFFSLVQERIAGNESFRAAWEKVLEIEDTEKSVFAWLEQTKPVKDEVVKQVVPELVAQRVLGFNMNMKEEPGTVLLRPIVAESAFKGNEEFVAANNLRVIRKDVETVLVRFGEGAGKLKSVFDEAAA